MLFLAFLACDQGDTAEPVDTGTQSIVHPCFVEEPILRIGEGDTDFVPFSETPEAMMIHGPQGGWHILVSFELENAMDIVEVQYQITHLDSGVMVSQNNYRLAIVSTAECAGYYPGMYGYLRVVELYDGNLDTPPELLAGDILRIDLRVNDCSVQLQNEGWCTPEERWIEASLDVIAILDPIDE